MHDERQSPSVSSIQEKVPIVLTFLERLQLNEGTLIEPLAGGDPPEQLDPDTVSGIVSLPKEFVREIIEGYTLEDETQALLLRYRDIRNYGRLQANRESSEQVYTVQAPRPKRPEVAQRTFEEIVKESLFDGPDALRLDRISGLVAKKPRDWRTSLTIIRTIGERYDLGASQNQSLAESVAEALEVAHDRHLFNKTAIRVHLPELYIGSWISHLDETSPGFERSTYTDLILRCISSIRRDTSTDEMLVILSGFTLGMKKLRNNLGEEMDQVNSPAQTIMVAFRHKLHQYPEVIKRIGDLIPRAAATLRQKQKPLLDVTSQEIDIGPEVEPRRFF
jgi:hypothetical protein